MTNSDSPDPAWINWIDAMRDAYCQIGKRDFVAALATIEPFITPETRPDIRSDALGLRADLNERLGRPEAAKDDLLTARSLIGATYARYVHELCLAAICQHQGLATEAASWYRAALRTCLEGEGISGGSALTGFLALDCERTASAEDRSLCAEVAKHSWHLLGLAGQPDLLNLPGAISAIKEGEAHPPRESQAASKT